MSIKDLQLAIIFNKMKLIANKANKYDKLENIFN